MLKSLVVLLALSSINGFATESSKSMTGFCQDRENPDYIQSSLEYEEQTLSFKNDGGIGGLGVCWWHSRFTRNATYLAYYSPELAKPSKREALTIIKKIRHGKEVIQIPGYANLFDFSLDYKAEIQKELNEWQLSNGAGFAWIRGLRGRTETSAKKLRQIMDKTYQQINEDKDLVFHKLQMKGVTAHSWLVVRMIKDNAGYYLGVLDSNFPNYLMQYRYDEGDTHFFNQKYQKFVPYIEYNTELKRIKSVVAKNCNKEEN